DATITPRYVQERGAMAELELRHMSKLTALFLAVHSYSTMMVVMTVMKTQTPLLAKKIMKVKIAG
ncbi:MAG: hypothetical protein MUQ57_00970, partial [Porticoccus sp.]|nr:hypothetical protein [Porticoccus sp.]